MDDAESKVEDAIAAGDQVAGMAIKINYDPRASLADWANQGDEWIRRIVRDVLSIAGPLGAEAIDYSYSLFRQEKALDTRQLPNEAQIQLQTAVEQSELSLNICKLSEIVGVNALVAGEVIEPHEGLTILFGENGTGKTGYARILKSLANSRSADVILGDVTKAGSAVAPSAKVAYSLGTDKHELTWTGEKGVAPFTRMSIFDSPCVNFHTDDDLEYVYVPSVLALFNHVNVGIKGVQEKIDAAIVALANGTSSFLSRFPKESSVYPLIESLGAATDLEDLKSRLNADPKAGEALEVLRRGVAALESDTVGLKLRAATRFERVLSQAFATASELDKFERESYNKAVADLAGLSSDYEAFRTELFKAANLPAEPEHTWEAFVTAGGAYKAHLESSGAHDESRCLYCRQNLDPAALDLLRRYGEYIADKIKSDINVVKATLGGFSQKLGSLAFGDVTSFLSEYEERDDKPAFYGDAKSLGAALESARAQVTRSEVYSELFQESFRALKTALEGPLEVIEQEVAELRDQSENSATTLLQKKKEVAELSAALELAKSWDELSRRVTSLKEADRLKILGRSIPAKIRAVTDLAKTASDQLINQNFDNLFREECEALRAPILSIEFVGRQGKAQRRKAVSGMKPSRILSEGEQKVLAMADFLAEARLAGITAPVIFDDPVSSLDYRRINEVSLRVAKLAEISQVIVFTHDILFATTLLGLFEKSKRCTYYQVTDENGKGHVTRASGPRWDTLSNIKKDINLTIEAAKKSEGETRAALVRTGYNWIRSWCEVFVETELLKGVTQRYQPNVRMTVLSEIKIDALPAAFAVVQKIFEDACRYIDGHSQPLPTLAVTPTLTDLESQWQTLLECKKTFDAS